MAKRKKLTDFEIERMEINARKRAAWGRYVTWRGEQNIRDEFQRTYPGADIESEEFKEFAGKKSTNLVYIG